jgi:hypothetical protein
MRLLFAAAVLSATLALPAGAADTAQQTGMKGGAKTAATPAPSMAMSGKPMMSGSMNSMKMEAGGQAKCKDGTTVTYKKRSGACSGHGGVASWM